jgi:AcrR family transcriptional regulator
MASAIPVVTSIRGDMMRSPAPRKKRQAALTPLWESEARSTPRMEGRARVLEAAATAFMERGYAVATLDHVAMLLGTTKGQIYHYYRSKLDLYFDVAVGAFYMINECITPLVEAEGVAAVERLHNVLRAMAMEIMERYPFHRVALEATQFQLIGRRSAGQERPQARISTLRKQLETTLNGLIGDAASEGSLQVASVPLATRASIGSLAWLTVWFDPTRPTNTGKREAIANHIADFIIGGLRTLPGSRPRAAPQLL